MSSTERYKGQQRKALREVPAKLATLLEQHRGIQSRTWDADGKKAATTAFRARVGGIRRDAQEAMNQAALELRQARRAQSSPSAAEQMGWVRLEAMLKAVPAGESAWLTLEPRLQRAANEGDTALLWAARAMLPDMLAAQGQPVLPVSLDWLDMMSPDPEVRAAVVLEKEFEIGRYQLDMALNFAEAELDLVQPIIAPNIPTFDRGQVVSVGGLDPNEERLTTQARRQHEMSVLAGLEYARAEGPSPDGSGS